MGRSNPRLSQQKRTTSFKNILAGECTQRKAEKSTKLNRRAKAVRKVKKSNRLFYCKERKYDMQENNTGTKTIKKIGKVTYEVVVHFNKNATETMQDKLKRIMLREMEMEKHQKGDKMIRKSLTSCYRSN